MNIPYYDKAHVACGMCVQQSSYAESEITSVVPQASSSFPHYVLPAMESWARAWEQILSACEPESFLPMATITTMKRSPSTFFAAGACFLYVATKCTKLHAICNHCTSQRVRVASIEILFAVNCRTYEIWGLKIVSEEIFQHLKFSKHPDTPPPDTTCSILKPFQFGMLLFGQTTDIHMYE